MTLPRSAHPHGGSITLVEYKLAGDQCPLYGRVQLTNTLSVASTAEYVVELLVTKWQVQMHSFQMEARY